MVAFLSFRTHTLAAAAVVVLAPAACFAQLKGQIAEKPLGIGYVRNITPERMVNYAKSLAERLEVAQETLKEIPTEQLAEMSSKKQEPINGVALYMVTGLIPTFETITFQEVVDEADVKRMLKFQAEQGGENSTLTGSDGNYKVVRSWSWKNELQEGQEAHEVNHGGNQRGLKRSSEVIEENGKRYHQQTQIFTQIYRYDDGFLFASNFDELHDMVLPTAETLVGGVSTANDMGGEAFADRIPLGMKQLAWNMLNATLSTQIQRRDDEVQETYDLRRSAGDLGLEIARSAIFDVEHAEAWWRFANEHTDVIRGEFLIDTRRNSSLGKSLEELASVRSRFGPMLQDNAAVTAHVGARLPEDTRPLFDAVAAWFELFVRDETAGDSAMVEAAQQVGATLQGIGEHGNLEVFAKLGWSAESGGVIYGGLQVDDNPRLLTGIHHLLTHVPGAPGEIGNQIQLIEESGQQYIRFEYPGSLAEDFGLGGEGIPLKLTHAYLTHQNSCLWFATGGENAFEILQQSVARTARPGLAARTNLGTFEFDADQWLSYPQDDETGIPGLLLWLDANVVEFPPGPIPNFGNFGGTNKPTPLLQRVFELGGARHFQFIVDADQSGLIAKLEMGEAIGNYYLARMVDAQDRMMQRNREQMEEQRKELENKARELKKTESESGP